MSIVTVNLVDTFDEWRIKTNNISITTGNLSSLNTTNKNSLVESINEVIVLSNTNLDNVVEDTSPELGADLDLNTHNIIGVGNITVTGTFTGTLAGTVTGVTQTTGDSSTKLATTQFVTNTTALIPVGGDVSGTTGNIQLANNSIGINELDVADGIAGQVLSTNGAGVLNFIDADLTVGGDISGTLSNAQIISNVVGINELNLSDGTVGQVISTDGNGTITFQDIFNETTVTPTANQTVFPITYIVDRIIVFLNGVKLVKGSDFAASNSTTVVLTAPVDATDIVEFHTFL